MLKKYFCLIIFVATAFAVSATAQDAGPTIVIVVRHAEKQTDEGNPDPSLSEQGKRRAQALARALEDAGVSAIYTTQFKRAKEMAQPLVERLKIPVTPVEVTAANFNGYSAALVKEILAKNAGKTVLVVGHGNTVPQIVQSLGGKLPPPIDELTEFNRLYVVIVSKSGATKVVSATYELPN